jgi:glycosyltransferase involved in cell wall biosynthesis
MWMISKPTMTLKSNQEITMRVAYYYNIPERLARDHPTHNPYGSLLCEALERRGYEIEFMMRFDADYLRENHGRIHILHLNWPHLIYYHDDAETMRRQMRDFVRTMELARELGYKLIWTAHNLYPHNRKHFEIDREGRFEICRLATAIIAHCDFAAAEIRQHFGRAQNVFVIPHGNYLGVYANPFTREQARAQLGVPADAFVYGLYGNVRPYKGIENLIDTFRRLPDQDRWLLIAGGSRDTDYLESIRRYIAEHPRIVLRTYYRIAPFDDLLLILNAADVITLPFKDVTTSGTLMLALSMAKPIIAPALGCLPMMADPGSGILYDPDETDALYHAMIAIRDRDLGEASRVAFASAEKFDWGKIAAMTIEVYRV